MVYLANLRLHDVGTDMLVTMYRTVETGTLSSSHVSSPCGLRKHLIMLKKMELRKRQNQLLTQAFHNR